MATTLPDEVRTVLQNKAYAHMITFNRDGSPQVSMVWVDADGDEVLINTAIGRVKEKNLRRDPRVILSVQDPSDAMAYVLIHGQATLTEEGAVAHIDKLANRYFGVDEYPYHSPEEPRIIVRITPDRVSGVAPGMGSWT